MSDWKLVCVKINHWLKCENNLQSTWKVDVRIFQKVNGDARDQASISVDTGDAGGMIEVWASGEMDFTRLDFKKLSTPGAIESFNFDSPDQAVTIINKCFESLSDGVRS
jgi:hypothetical protein